MTAALFTPAEARHCPHCGSLLNDERARAEAAHTVAGDVPGIAELADDCWYQAEWLAWLTLTAAGQLPPHMDHQTVHAAAYCAQRFGASNDQITAAIEAGEAMR